MKSKFLIICCASVMAGTLALLTCFEPNNHTSKIDLTYSNKLGYEQGESQDILYQVDVNNGHLINTTISNAVIENQMVKASLNSYITWSNDLDSPIRGISSISLTRASASQAGLYYFYFSFNHLTLDNILDGKYQDLEFVKMDSWSESGATITFDVNKIDHKYFLLLYLSPSTDAYFSDLSVVTPCTDEPYRGDESIGTITDYQTELRNVLPSHVPFIGNGSYSIFDDSDFDNAKAIMCIQKEFNYSIFENALVANGYIHSKTINDQKYYQKDLNDSSYYTVMIENQSTHGDLSIKSITFVGEGQWIGKSFVNGCIGYSDSVEDKTEILGKLEKNAMENFLTGIPLFENDNYVRFSSRVSLASENYIAGYGWGLLEEGELNGTLPNVSQYQNYLQLGVSSDPLSINGWDSTGSQVKELNKKITAPLWGKRIVSNNSYEFYPVLAKDTVGGQNFRFPIHVEPDNQTGLYKTWKVYVKTGFEEGIRYRTASNSLSSFNNQYVQLEDYEFVYQMLLSRRSQVVCGSELANDTIYGIKGGQDFYKKSNSINDNETLDNLWNQMKQAGELGISTGTDANGSYIQIEFVTAMDEFTALITLSNNLFSPIPKSFLQQLGNGDYTLGARKFGLAPSYNSNILDYALCIGPYYLEKWDKSSRIVFSINSDWFETTDQNRYNIPGVVYKVYSQALENPNCFWDLFNNGELDYVQIPTSQLSNVNPNDKREPGNENSRLTVNSCTQARWNELFGANGTVAHQSNNSYICKPWMSNKNFLNGLFWSINREQYARARGHSPTINYFSDSYFSDPKMGVQYNQTQAHTDAISEFHDVVNDIDNYGYDLTKAINFFKLAVDELVKSGEIQKGTKNSPTTISISILWMYQTEIYEYGEQLANYFQTAFNDERVSGGTVRLIINQSAPSQWQYVYYDISSGKFDLAFAPLSGSEYNPLSFMETLKSDNSSGFTLSWGIDTSKIDPYNPIEFDNKVWSFDALWEAGMGYSTIKNSAVIDPVIQKRVQNSTTNNLYNGGTITIACDFADIGSDVQFNITSTKICIFGYGSVEVETQLIDGKIVIELSLSLAEYINDLIVQTNNLQKNADKTQNEDQRFEILHPFTFSNYNDYWCIEMHYTISVNSTVLMENNLYIDR